MLKIRSHFPFESYKRQKNHYCEQNKIILHKSAPRYIDYVKITSGRTFCVNKHFAVVSDGKTLYRKALQ